ncbi:hypothetical protein [Epilithonimonas hominis]|nr:hypothetical protein [Epilithonimonas hominis]
MKINFNQLCLNRAIFEIANIESFRVSPMLSSQSRKSGNPSTSSG